MIIFSQTKYLKQFIIITLILAITCVVQSLPPLFAQQQERIIGISISGNRQVLAIDYYASANVDFFDATTGNLLHSATLSRSLRRKTLSPTGDRLVWTDSTGSIYLYNTNTGNNTTISQGGEGSSVGPIAWHPTDESFAITMGSIINVYDVSEEEDYLVFAAPTGTIIGDAGRIVDIAWSLDGEHLATSHYTRSSLEQTDYSRTIQLWDYVEGTVQTNPMERFEDTGGGEVVWNPDGSQVAILGSGELQVYSLVAQAFTANLTFPEENPAVVEWSPDGKFLATGGAVIRIWDTENWALSANITPEVHTSALQWSSNGDHLFSNQSSTGLTMVENPVSEIDPDDLSIIALNLINADTGVPISGYDPIPIDPNDPLSNINIVLPDGVSNISIDAQTSVNTESVIFGLDANPSYQTESTAPYALAGNDGNDFIPWDYNLNQPYTLTATPYAEAGGGGAAGIPVTIHFTITASSSNDPAVTDLILMDADTDEPILGYDPIPINPSDPLTPIEISLPTGTSNINIDAQVTNNTASVVFGLDGDAGYQVESLAPYALAGNDGNDFAAWSYTANQSYTLTVTPYSESGGNGIAGTPLTINFVIISESPPTECHGLVQEAEHGSLAGAFTIVSDPTASGGQYIEVPNNVASDYSGKSVHRSTYCFTVETPGMYRLRGSTYGIDNSHDSFLVLINGNQSPWYIPIATSFQSAYYGGSTPAEFVLMPGEQQVVIIHREHGSRLDTIELELVSSVIVSNTYRINVGGDQFIDASGNVWDADRDFIGGQAHDFIPSTIANTVNDDLYATERSVGTFEYNIPVSATGIYVVRLHFAELWWVPGRGGAGNGGDRFFDVQIEGNTVLDGFDPTFTVIQDTGASIGYLTANIQTFSGITAPDGELTITFTNASIDHPSVAGIEVFELATQ